MPPSIPKHYKRTYTDILRALMTSETWHESLMPHVESYFIGLHMLHECQSIIEREGRYFTDDKGNIKPHPAIADMGRASNMLNTHGRFLQLNVTPSYVPGGKSDSKEEPSGKWSL